MGLGNVWRFAPIPGSGSALWLYVGTVGDLSAPDPLNPSGGGLHRPKLTGEILGKTLEKFTAPLLDPRRRGSHRATYACGGNGAILSTSSRLRQVSWGSGR